MSVGHLPQNDVRAVVHVPVAERPATKFAEDEQRRPLLALAHCCCKLACNHTRVDKAACVHICEAVTIIVTM